MEEQDFAALRKQMLLEIAADTLMTRNLIGRDALDERVMEVMGQVPRHEFVPVELQPYAYLNRPLPIGFEKTISQPFIVALMTDLLQIQKEDIILEIIEELGKQATKRLARMGYANIEVRLANGYHGWPELAPFDKMIVTAAPDLIPAALINQLKPGGRMVIPAGLPDSQQLVLVEKNSKGKVSTTEILPVRFSQLEGGETG